MGIKDNFSQAVKELWKKDSEQQDNASRQAKPTELDKYLRQEQEKLNSEVEQDLSPEQQTAAPVQNAAAPAQNVQNTQSVQNNTQNVQTAQQNQAATGFASTENQQREFGSPDAMNANRNVQNIRSNFGQNNLNSGAQGSYTDGSRGDGYNQGYGRPAPQSYGQGGGNGFVPPTPNNAPMQEASDTEEITVISKNTHIDGNVRSLANMQIDGNIKGNVETTRNVDLSGKIIGDIVCNNAGMNSAAMQGNVSLKGRMRMDRDTILIGDLSSQYADINGRIRGKLDITGKAELKRDAIVFGDINASTIAVTDGAIIQGYVNTTFLSKEDSRNVFPDAISIDSKE